jgi:hypothetical protein
MDATRLRALVQGILSKRVAGVLFALDLCGILVFGLWPFGHPRNDVTWVPNQQAIQLGKRATILSLASSSAVTSCTLEMLIKPTLSDDSSTLLAFYGPRGTLGVSLHQSLTDLRLDIENGNVRRTKRYVDGIFQAGRIRFLGVVTDSEGTAVYVDGALARLFPGFRSAEACSGRFVVGDSPTENDTWQGQFRGLAIFHQTLSAEQLASDHESWMSGSYPFGNAIRADSLYLFNEHSGRLIRDHGKSEIDLQIPERYAIVRQTLLESPWRAFQPTWGYVEDLTINVFGFAPFGITLYAFMRGCGWKRGVGLKVVLVGLLTSLAIETLQSCLPTRDSDLTDVLTNTLGTWLGAYLFSRMLKAPVTPQLTNPRIG